MAEPRRIIPSRPSAQRLSDDIGDVLGTIRRLIAEDEALSSARDRLRDLRDRQPAPLRAIDSATPSPDPGEAIAHRHGGNAALARALAGLSRDLPESAASEPMTTAPEADAAPDLPDADDFAALMSNADHGAQNDLARRLSATFAPAALSRDLSESLAPALPTNASEATVPESVTDAPEAAAAPALSDADDFDALMAAADDGAQSDPAPGLSTAFAPDGDSGPLRLGQPLPAVDRPMQGPLLPETPPAATAARVDFDEDFDWKAHMRPDLPPDPEPVPLPLRSDIQPPADHRDAKPDMQGVDAMNEEETIREWLREMIREELLGELGQRFSRNLRSLIRREVAVTIDDQLDRL